jgi:hypothetical protein
MWHPRCCEAPSKTCETSSSHNVLTRTLHPCQPPPLQVHSVVCTLQPHGTDAVVTRYGRWGAAKRTPKALDKLEQDVRDINERLQVCESKPPCVPKRRSPASASRNQKGPP